MKKLSIITVCKNEERNIERTLKSVINQTFSDFEYIVVDGASTDATIDIINKYKDKIDIFISEADSGIFNAQMKGYLKSSGEYIYFLNSGDYLVNDFVLEKAFLFNPVADIVYGDIVFEMKNGRHYIKKSFKKLSPYKLMIESLPHPATLTKRTVFDKCGLYDESYRIIADYEFLLRALFQKGCSTQYITLSFAVFNLQGLSSKTEHTRSYKLELKKAQRENIPKRKYILFKIFKPFSTFFGKKLRYLIYFLSGLFNKNL